MRLIDADALDAAFTDLRFSADGTLAHWGDRPDWCLHGSEVEKLIENAPTIGGWISVKDRLPEIPHENPQRGILVVDGNGNVSLTRALLKTEIQGEELIFDDTHSDCFFDLVSGKKQRINTVIKGNHIVYWMPLPEPPKENE